MLRAFVVVATLAIACGSKTGLVLDRVERDASIDVRPDSRPDVSLPGPCTHLEVVSEPTTWWAASGDIGWGSPKLAGRNGGFDLVARRRSPDHAHVHARRLELSGDGVEPGPEQRVITETHDNHQVTAAGERLAICTGADPGGPLRVVFRGYRGAYVDRLESEFASSTSCQGLIATDTGFQIAFIAREPERRGMFASLSVVGEPLGESVQPLAGMPDIETTIRIGRFDRGWAGLKRRNGRRGYFVGVMERESERAIARHEAVNKALYLRTENWPLSDGALAVSYIDTTDEVEAGLRHLLVLDEEGVELHHHVSGETRFSFIEPEMREMPSGLLWATPDVRSADEVRYVIELFTTGAEPLGGPIVFTEGGTGHTTVTVAFSSGLIAVAWDRRTEDGRNDEIAGALLRCAR